MARRRMIDPSFWDDESVGKLSDRARLLFICCVSQADDEGKLSGNAAWLKKICFGFTNMSVLAVDRLLQQIDENVRAFHRYVVDGQPYIVLKQWTKYQKVDHPYPSSIPGPFSEQYQNSTGMAPENQTLRKEGSTKEGSTKEGRRQETSPTPPIAKAYSTIMLGGRRLTTRELSTAKTDFDDLKQHPQYHRLDDEDFALKCCADWWNERAAKGKLATEMRFKFFCQDLIGILDSAGKPEQKRPIDPHSKVKTGPGWRDVQVNGKTYHVPPWKYEELEHCVEVTFRLKRVEGYTALEDVV